VWKRVFVASVFAVGLQWGTTGSAAVIVVFTPTIGLGCRFGSYIFYGIISTMIWLGLLLSSYLAHYTKARYDDGVVPRPGFNSTNLADSLATFLRWSSILTADCNAIFIIMACIFQFSNFYTTCYCNSGPLGRGGQRAYITIVGGYRYDHMEAAWIGGVVLSGGCIVLFLLFLRLMLRPSPLPHFALFT
jgi:hypothetical protein